MEKWKRWQDWVALAAGVVAALAPVFTDTTTRATWTMVVLGVLTIAASVYSLAKPGDVLSEGSHLVLGALLIILAGAVARPGRSKRVVLSACRPVEWKIAAPIAISRSGEIAISSIPPKGTVGVSASTPAIRSIGVSG